MGRIVADTAVTSGQVAVYIDFDNIVISRYDQLHGRQAFRDDKAHSRNPSTVVQRRLAEARIDLDAVISFASSFGNVAISRAYANWASPLHRRPSGRLKMASWRQSTPSR